MTYHDIWYHPAIHDTILVIHGKSWHMINPKTGLGCDPKKGTILERIYIYMKKQQSHNSDLFFWNSWTKENTNSHGAITISLHKKQSSSFQLLAARGPVRQASPPPPPFLQTPWRCQGWHRLWDPRRSHEGQLSQSPSQPPTADAGPSCRATPCKKPSNLQPIGLHLHPRSPSITLPFSFDPEPTPLPSRQSPQTGPPYCRDASERDRAYCHQLLQRPQRSLIAASGWIV